MSDPHFNSVVLQTGFEGSGAIPEQTIYFVSGNAATPDTDAEFTVVNASFSGANNATSFTDELNRVWTRAGNSILSSGAMKFAGDTSSAYMDGSGDYFSTPYSAAMDFGTGDFTVECWFRLAGASGVTDGSGLRRSTLIGCSQSSTGWAITLEGTSTVSGASGVIYIECRLSGALQTVSMSKGSAYNYHQWYHMALTRQNGTSRFFIDGVLLGSNTGLSQAVNMGGQPLYIGTSTMGSWSGDMNGYIAHARVTPGKARYTSNFWTGAAGYASDIAFYANFNTAFVDEAASPITLTPVGNAALSTSIKKFGVSSAHFPDTTSALTFTSPSKLNLGTGNFTVEFWAYPTTVGGGATRRLFSCETGTQSLVVREESNVLKAYFRFGDGTAYFINGSTNITLNTWNHIALVRSGTSFALFLNGALIGTITNAGAINLTGVPGVIGSTGVEGWAGYIDSMSIFKFAKYPVTGSFAVPLAEAPDISAAISGPYPTVGVPSIDATGKNVTTNGTSVLSPSQKKFNYNTSIRFKGTTSSYLHNNNDAAFTFGLDDFTVEMWVYRTSEITAAAFFYDGRPGATNGAYPTWYVPASNGNIPVYFANSATQITGTVALPLNAWCHVALCRKSGVTRMFINGVQSGGNYVDATAYLSGGSSRPLVSYDGNANNGSGVFNGYMQEIIVSRGVGKYASNFTPPTSAFTLPSNNYATPVDALPELKGKVLKPFKNPAVSTTVARRGLRSLLLLGTPSYPNCVYSDHSADYNPGGGDFTAELWIYPTSLQATGWNGLMAHMSTGNPFTGWQFAIHTTFVLVTEVNSGTASGTLMYGKTVPALNKWHHVALTKKGSVWSMWLNGALECRMSFSASVDVTVPLYIGSERGLSGGFAGYIDDVRITKGVARYDVVASATQDEFWNATVVSVPVSSPSTGVIDDANSTILMLRMDAFTDEVANTTVTNVSCTINSSIKKFGNSSCRLPGNAYLRIDPICAKFTTNPDWTIEGWFYWESGTCLFSFHDSAGSNRLVINDASLFGGTGNTVPAVGFTGGATMVLNTWVHVAVTWTGADNSIRVYKNGVLHHTTTITGFLNIASTDKFSIGQEWDGGAASDFFVGYIDDFRISRGVRYTTAGFTPPDEHPNVSQVYDLATGITVTSVGAVKTSADKKYGTMGLFFNASSHLTFASNAAFNFGTNDFTIDFWVKPLSITGAILYDQWNFQSAGSYPIGQTELYMQADGSLRFIVCTSASVYANYPITPVGSIVTGQWQHVAVVRSNGVITVYVDGIAKAAAAFTGQVGVTAVAGFGREAGTNAYFYNGYMDDFRITKAARWTTAFTPPAQESYREVAAAFLPPQTLSTGIPTVSGVIRDAAGAFASRQVYAYDRATGELVGSDISDGVTGAYAIGVNSTNTFVVALDDNTAPDLNAIIVDRIVPV